MLIDRWQEMKLLCPLFVHNEMIPSRFTCDGQDISPPLQWKNAPPETQSFALIMDDPDAPIGTWVHWILFNIPAHMDQLGEDIKLGYNFPVGAKHGRNSWKRTDYGGPCPPGGTHRYFFKLFALDRALEIDEGITKKILLKEMQGHILNSCEMIGFYKRSR